MPRARLGRSELKVSRLSLGSWRTFERIPREDGLAVMQAAREHGINFLDDARYNDETGNAPIPTGYSEVLFGELFRAAGWDRDDTRRRQQAVVGVLARAERRRRARRLAGPDGLRLRRPDLRQPAARRPAGAGHGRRGGRARSTTGKARAWGIVNWEAGPFAEAIARGRRSRASRRRARRSSRTASSSRDWVESPEMTARAARHPAPASSPRS